MSNNEPSQIIDFNRRSFIAASASVGAGLLAVQSLIANAAEGSAAVVPPSTAPAAGVAGAPATAPAAGPAFVKVSDVLARARTVMAPVCRVCPECNGVACAGEVPGMGGFGSGMSFKNNFTALQHVELRMRTLHDVKKPDMGITLFGEKLVFPALAAPTGGTTYNMGGKLGEEAFAEAILAGSAGAGTLGAIADGIGDPVEVFEKRLAVLGRLGVKAIVGLKPRTQEEIIARIRKAEAANVVAITIDVDSSGRAARALPGQTVEPKTPRQLRELVQATRLPILVKGIMTVDDALAARDAGVAGIVVSNHGGRVLDHTPGTAEVLPAIADKVKGSMIILTDGCVRYGHDVLKYLALGADAVLVGRHLIRGAHGGGAPGVTLLLKTMQQEMEAAMTLTGTASARTVTRSILA